MTTAEERVQRRKLVALLREAQQSDVRPEEFGVVPADRARVLEVARKVREAYESGDVQRARELSDAAIVGTLADVELDPEVEAVAQKEAAGRAEPDDSPRRLAASIRNIW